jgi:hypothetical protein
LRDALIADAKYLASLSDPPQLREAVLLAAIACEVTIKQTLRAACSNAARPVLDWALDNPRDVSEQAAGLFDKTAKAVTGRSLREENKAVHKGARCSLRGPQPGGASRPGDRSVGRMDAPGARGGSDVVGCRTG